MKELTPKAEDLGQRRQKKLCFKGKTCKGYSKRVW